MMDDLDRRLRACVATPAGEFDADGRAGRGRDLARDQARRQLGPDDRVIVADERVTVSAVDLGYGNPPAQRIPAGTYQLTLVDLVIDDVGYSDAGALVRRPDQPWTQAPFRLTAAGCVRVPGGESTRRCSKRGSARH